MIGENHVLSIRMIANMAQFRIQGLISASIIFHGFVAAPGISARIETPPETK
jgi:hypothetical protein